MTFSHENLQVYQRTLTFNSKVSTWTDQWDSKHAVRDHLSRAAGSMLENIAMASAAFSAMKTRSVDYAIGSNLECAACLDLARIKRLLETDKVYTEKEELSQILRMLVGLRKSWSKTPLTTREDPVEYKMELATDKACDKAYDKVLRGNPMTAIRTENLTRSFGDVLAVDRLTLSVAKGELFGLVGPDGAGKTTTMRLLTAILDPTSGDAWVAGHHSVREAPAIKNAIGYMSQRFGLYPDLTVMQNVNFYADIYGVPQAGRSAQIERLLAFSNLTPFKKRLAGRLSGGMKQKLGLACALIHTPQVLFLDEPTNGVDPVSRRDFWRILYQLIRDGVTIFVSTAYLDEAERCARLALIHRGKLLAVGTPDEVKRLMRDTILEVRTGDPRQAASLLRSELPECSVGLFGDRVHVATGDSAATQTKMEAILRGAGIENVGIRTVLPTLEDVFVSVLAHESKEVRHE